VPLQRAGRQPTGAAGLTQGNICANTGGHVRQHLCQSGVVVETAVALTAYLVGPEGRSAAQAWFAGVRHPGSPADGLFAFGDTRAEARHKLARLAWRALLAAGRIPAAADGLVLVVPQGYHFPAAELPGHPSAAPGSPR